MTKTRVFKRIISAALCFAMILSLVPGGIFPSEAAVTPTVVTDPGTSSNWDSIMGTDADGARYAGRVWVDKSVYADGETVRLNNLKRTDSSFVADVDTANGEYFQVVFSALGSSMSSNTTITGSRPLDVVFVFDTSTSMDDTSGGKTRLEHMITAANSMLADLLALNDVRIAIVSFNADSETIIPLEKYTNGINLSVNSYTDTRNGGVITAKDNSGATLGSDSGYTSGTNLQDGIDRGMNILASASDTEGRTPVAIVLADGRANRAVREEWYDIDSANRGTSGDAGIMLSTLLNAAYGKTRVEKNYGTDMQVYGIGIDLSTSSNDYIFLNPGASGSAGFNESNTDSDVKTAWNAFVTWRSGNTATISGSGGGYWGGSTTWTFDHNWPSSVGVTTAEIAANINYVDNYQDVAGASLGDAFDKIYQELATSAFNPITSTKDGATGVEDTPLIYADNIGKYMEVRNIQAVQVFDQTFNVTSNGNGTYSVAYGTGTNPTTNEAWNTTEDIKIEVLKNDDGTQQLRVHINQEILPILLDKITVNTVNGVTTRKIETTEYPPLRIYYTIGIDKSVLLSDGSVDMTKIDPTYAHVNSDGTVSFYANAYGGMNVADLDNDGFVDLGDAHVGFVPSHENRFYYHQAHQEIFTSVTHTDGTAISDSEWEDGLYGIRWDPTQYKVKEMSYADYAAVTDSTRVYTYVTFNRPVEGKTDGTAEEVTYLVYTTWGDLKDAVTFYDKDNDVFLNGGEAIDVSSVGTVVGTYMGANSGVTDSDLIAVLGLQSRRVSRLHNMFEYKASNDTASAELAYAPAYNKGAHDQSDIHEHSEVIVWLGNNGRVTLPAGTGVKVTKNLTEVAADASADEKFKIDILIDTAYSTETANALTVVDGNGNAVANAVSESTDNKILVEANLANGESVYILGLPAGVDYTVTEKDHDKYTATYTGATRTVAGKINEVVVTNEPVKPGALYITKEVEHAFGGESFPIDKEFDFTVTFLDKNDQPIANHRFELENNYDTTLTSLTTDPNGVMTGKLRHGETVYIKGIPAGAKVTVVETAPADGIYTLKNYRSRNNSGDDATDSTEKGYVVIQPDRNATVVVTNTYNPKSTTVDLNISGTKNFELVGSQNLDSGGSFTFVVERWNKDSQTWEPMAEKSVTLTYAVGETSSTKTFAFNDVLEGITYDRAGTYTYQVREITGTVANVTYDRMLWTFTVNVTDNNGQLVATVTDVNNTQITDGSYEVTFNNYYNTAIVSIDIVKEVNDTSENPETSKAGFEFKAVEAGIDSEGNWTEKANGATMTVFSDGAGEARMTATYRAEGAYYYLVSEVAGTKTNWDYSDAKYGVTVTITKDQSSGKLTAVMTIETVGNGTQKEVATVTDGTKGKIVFANTYEPEKVLFPADTTPLVNKELTGRKMTEGEFEFAIYENGKVGTETALATGKNAADGTVAFSNKLTFTKVGKYEYDVVELKGTDAGMTYDSTIYDLVVEVFDNGDGTLGARYYFEDSVSQTVTFKNTYTVSPIDVVINGVKTLNVVNGSKALKAGDYTFGLYEAGKKIAETKNLANGTFAFDAITYDTDDIAREYTYTVKEIAPNGTTDGSYSAGGVTWSAQSFEVTVTIRNKGNGVIEATVTGNGAENIAFVNTYESKPVSVSLSGTKVLEGRELTAGEFKFALYKTDSAFENRSLVSSGITHEADGKINVDLGTLYEGEHYFVLTEVVPDSPAPGIHYSGAEYHVSVRVSDNGGGQMDYALSVSNPGDPNATDIVFTNLYSPASTEIVLSGTKTYEGGVALEDDKFSVGLYYGTELIDTALVKADGTFTFNELYFDAANVGNSYAFTVKEIIPDGATDNGNGTWTYGNIVYDASEYTVTVTVKDEVKDGVLEITKTVTKGGTAVNGIEFTNTFVPSPIDYTITAKKSYDKGLKGGDFEFTLVSADGKTNVNQTKTNAADGSITFDPVTFASEGEYKFKLTEKKDGIFGFIRPSDAEYEITVKVVKNNGVLSVESAVSVNTKNSGESNLEFENVYLMDGEGEITLSGSKKLTGDRTAVSEGEFEFGLYDSEGALVEAVKNGADGKFVFKALKFDETGVPVNGQKQYTYTVKEIAGDNARYTYDSTVYTVVVTVKDNDEGGIEVSYTVNGAADTAIEFTNTYKNPAPVTYKPVAEKSYNKPLKGGDFKFTLVGEINGVKVEQEKTNAADGSITFDELSFPEAGTYTFTVKEIGKILGFINYSKAEYEIVVEVVDTKGVLSLGSVTVNEDPDGNLEFVNTYVISGSSEITVSGEKTLAGRELRENEFEFKLTEVDAEGKAVENGKVLSAKNGKDGKFSFTLTYAPEDIGTHYYKVTEVKGNAYGVTYDSAEYTLKVVASDNDEGGVKTELTVDGGKEIVFANTYKAETVLDVNVNKTVKNTGAETIGPEGFEFVLENKTTGLKTTLVTDENGKATVTLGYNEADIGKTYNYTVSEVKGDKEHVTYSDVVYTVRVTIYANEDGKLVPNVIVNGMPANSVTCEFENVYDYTPEAPSTGVNLRTGLWAVMMAVSVLGLCGLVVFKKREER